MPLWLRSACDTSGISVNANGMDYIGVFGRNDGTVKNLTVSDCLFAGDSFAGASLSPGGTCVAALPTRRSQARRAETDFTAVQRAGACALSDVLTGSWSERREINI